MSKIVKSDPSGVDVAKLASYKQQAEGLAEFLEAQPCSSPEEEAWFSQNLGAVRGLLKDLEDSRTSVTKPMIAAKAKVDGLFAPATKPLQRCEAIIRAKLAEAATARFQAAAEARRLAESASQAGDFEAVVVALAEAPVDVKGSGSSAKAVYVAEVVDFAALPDQYKMVNARALHDAGGVFDGEPDLIPGVVWRLEAKVRAR